MARDFGKGQVLLEMISVMVFLAVIFGLILILLRNQKNQFYQKPFLRRSFHQGPP